MAASKKKLISIDRKDFDAMAWFVREARRLDRENKKKRKALEWISNNADESDMIVRRCKSALREEAQDPTPQREVSGKD